MLLAFSVGLAMLVLGIVLGWAGKATKMEDVSITKAELDELERLRQAVDQIHDDALERVEFDSFAQVVVDTIRKHTRRQAS
jgi:hypothetical protein